MLDDNAPASGAVRPRLSVIVCSPGRCVRFPTGLCADVSKAGALLKTTLLFSTLLMKQNNLVVIIACGWRCATVPICLEGGHKSWHNRDGAMAPDSHTGSYDIRILVRDVFRPAGARAFTLFSAPFRRIHSRVIGAWIRDGSWFTICRALCIYPDV